MNNSSESYKRYVWLLFGPIFVVVVSIAAIGIWVGPATGDLTRISKYSDRDFGFNSKEEWLVKPNLQISRAPFDEKNNWVRQGDILVFGDSFSDRRAGKLSWLDLVQHRFNVPMHIVLPANFVEVAQYLESPQFKNNPPRAIVVQTVERAFRNRALSLYANTPDQAACLNLKMSLVSANLVDTGLSLPILQKDREAHFATIHDLFDRSTNVVRKLLRPTKTRVVLASLSSANLFTNARSDQILLYDEDLTKHQVRGLSDAELNLENVAIRCNLKKLVHAAGRVPLVFVLVPDKRTVYSPWITSPMPAKESDLQAILYSALGDAALDLTPVLQSEVRRGVQDVYAPNDSHWGIPGHYLAAEALSQYLSR